MAQTNVKLGFATCLAVPFPSPSMGEGRGEGERSDGTVLTFPSSQPSPTRVEEVATQSAGGEGVTKATLKFLNIKLEPPRS